MDRRHLLQFLAGVVFAATITPARASSDDDDDEDEDDHDDERDDDGHETDDESSSNDNNDSSNNSSNTQTHEQENEEEEEEEDDDHQDALKAVQDDQALSLQDMLIIFRIEFDEKILDVSLFTQRAILVYRFRYIDEHGRVLSVLYEAANGTKIIG